MTSINFKANFVKTVNIPHTSSDFQQEPVDASIVEFDTNNENDMQVLCDVAKEWEKNGAGYSMHIYNDAKYGHKYASVVAEHFYALTTQNNNYDKLNPDNILGLTVFSEKNQPEDEIAWLQVDPNHNYDDVRWKRKYFNVGKSLVDFIKNMVTKPLMVVSSESAVPFYEKQDFHSREGKHPLIMYWGDK